MPRDANTSADMVVEQYGMLRGMCMSTLLLLVLGWWNTKAEISATSGEDTPTAAAEGGMAAC